jgi:tRNA A22 N-methylase
MRKSICKKGFYISDELLIKEGSIVSLIVHFTKGSKRYSMSDYLLGPILRHKNDDIYKEWLLDNIKKKEILYLQIPRKFFLRKDHIRKKLHILKSEIK